MTRDVIQSGTSSADSGFDRPAHEIVIKPTSGWRWPDLRELWAYRELFLVLTTRDIKVRYKQTVLGFGWAIIQPVMLMVVFSIFFGGLARIPSDGYPYPVFVFSALVPWTFFANAVTSASNSVVGSANLISKVYFPRLLVPVSAVGVSLVDCAISTTVLLLLMAFFGVGWSVNLFAIPVLFAGLILTALGIGTFLSALTVAYRDVRYALSFLLQFWMFATPVVYPVSLVPESWRYLYYLNPMVGIIEGFRSTFLGKPFHPGAIAISFLVAIAFLAIGLGYFEKEEQRFSDII